MARTYWNGGEFPARYLAIISPPGFASYFEAPSEGLASAGDSEEEAIRIRKRLSEEFDIEVLGPSRRAGS